MVVRLTLDGKRRRNAYFIFGMGGNGGAAGWLEPGLVFLILDEWEEAV